MRSEGKGVRSDVRNAEPTAPDAGPVETEIAPSARGRVWDETSLGGMNCTNGGTNRFSQGATLWRSCGSRKSVSVRGAVVYRAVENRLRDRTSSVT